eukprot:6961069-Karenia_brevis.AAC.1
MQNIRMRASQPLGIFLLLVVFCTTCQRRKRKHNRTKGVDSGRIQSSAQVNAHTKSEPVRAAEIRPEK